MRDRLYSKGIFLSVWESGSNDAHGQHPSCRYCPASPGCLQGSPVLRGLWHRGTDASGCVCKGSRGVGEERREQGSRGPWTGCPSEAQWCPGQGLGGTTVGWGYPEARAQAKARCPLRTLASSWVTLLWAQFPVWRFGYHSNLMLLFSDQRSQVIQHAFTPALVWQPGQAPSWLAPLWRDQPGWPGGSTQQRGHRWPCRRARRCSQAWAPPGSPGCSRDQGCPALAVVTWTPESCPAWETLGRGSAGTWMAWSRELSLQFQTATRESALQMLREGKAADPGEDGSGIPSFGMLNPARAELGSQRRVVHPLLPQPPASKPLNSSS